MKRTIAVPLVLIASAVLAQITSSAEPEQPPSRLIYSVTVEPAAPELDAADGLVPASATAATTAEPAAFQGAVPPRLPEAAIDDPLAIPEPPPVAQSALSLVDPSPVVDSVEHYCGGRCGHVWDGYCQGDCDSGCGDGCGGSCRDLVYGRIDYLHWWSRGSRNPPLVTTSDPALTMPVDAGVLGLTTTTTLFGGDRVDGGDRTGGRLTLGAWLTCDQLVAVQADYWGLERERTTFTITSANQPVIARPFTDFTTGLQNASLVAYPGLENGTATVRTTSDVRGAGVLFRRAVGCNWPWRVDVLAGYRYLRLDDGLTIDEDSIVTQMAGGAVPFGTTFEVSDQFSTQNDFHGGDLGVLAEWEDECWSLSLLAKLALGNNRQRVWIDGSTTSMVPGMAPVTSAGGLLALDSNIGNYRRDEFIVVPEIGVTLNLYLTECLTVNVGYTLIYASDVVRPGDQIDTTIDPRQIPPPSITGGTRPAFSFQETDYWAQGLSIGTELRF